MNAVADVLRRYGLAARSGKALQAGFVPTVPSPHGEVGTPQSLVQSHVPTVPTVPIEKYRERAEPAEVTPATVTGTERLRSALLALADGLGVDRGLVDRLTTADLMACKGLTVGTLRSYLHGLDAIATRQAGKVPADETAPIYCEQCGPVWAHPSVAAVLPVVDGWPRALGCPWCFIRKAGGYIPRPLVACATCASYQPDTVNPAAGMGTCACGMHHPMQRHRCDKYQPKGANHD